MQSRELDIRRNQDSTPDWGVHEIHGDFEDKISLSRGDALTVRSSNAVGSPAGFAKRRRGDGHGVPSFFASIEIALTKVSEDRQASLITFTIILSPVERMVIAETIAVHFARNSAALKCLTGNRCCRASSRPESWLGLKPDQGPNVPPMRSARAPSALNSGGMAESG